MCTKEIGGTKALGPAKCTSCCSTSSCKHSLNKIDFLDENVPDICAVQVVGLAVEAAPPRVAKAVGTNLGEGRACLVLQAAESGLSVRSNHEHSKL